MCFLSRIGGIWELFDFELHYIIMNDIVNKKSVLLQKHVFSFLYCSCIS